MTITPETIADRAVDALENAMDSAAQSMKAWAQKPEKERAEVARAISQLLLFVLIAKTAPKRLTELTAVLNELGVPVPALSREQARRIWRSTAYLAAALAYRAGSSAQTGRASVAKR